MHENVCISEIILYTLYVYYVLYEKLFLALYLLNFLNRIIHPSFLELSIIIFRDIKMKTLSWSADSIEPNRDIGSCEN